MTRNGDLSNLRVVLVNDHSCVRGGSDEVAIATASGLAQAGIQVCFISASRGTTDPRLEHPGIELLKGEGDSVASGRRDLRVAANSIYSGATRRLLRRAMDGGSRKRPAILHLHGWGKAASVSPMGVAARMGIPCVVSAHDYQLVCPTGMLFDSQRGQSCELSPLSVRCAVCNCDRRSYADKVFRFVRQLAWSSMALKRSLKYVIAVSRKFAAGLQPFLGREVQVFPLHNPVRAMEGPPVSPEQNRDYLYVGRLAPEKGVVPLASVAAKKGLSVVFAGDGELKASLARDFPAHRFIGWVEAADLVGWVRRARAIILPSLCQETFGMTVLEAGSIGVPAVVSGNAGVSEVLEHGRSALICNPMSADTLSRCLDELKDDKLVGEMGRAVRTIACSRPFQLEGYVEQLLSIYERIIAHHRAK